MACEERLQAPEGCLEIHSADPLPKLHCLDEHTCKGSGLIVSLCRHCGILGVYIYNARAALQDRIDQGTCAKAGVSYLIYIYIDLWFLM